MKSIAEMSSLELAAYVCDTLKQRGILTTLSGGFCTEIYSCGAYTSMDIDLINQYNEDHKKIVSIMLELGFKQDGRYFYHDDALYAIEFPSGPPAVGDELIKDRLAAYYFWNSDRTLEQALWIAEKNPFDMQNIENWSHTEGMDQKFATFKAKYFEMMSEAGKLD